MSGETFVDCYQVLKDLVTFMLTLAGLVIAGLGLQTWKKQTRGIKEFDVGYNLNYAVLKVREGIKRVRDPWIPNYETANAIEVLKTKYPHKSPDEIQRSADWHVYELRWQSIADALTEMDSHLLGAEILWGPDVMKHARAVRERVGELRINLHQYFEPEMRTEDPSEIRKVVYGRFDDSDKDEFGKSVDQVVKEFTTYIKHRLD